LNPRVVDHLGETAVLEQEREALLSAVVATWSDAFERTENGATADIDRLPPEPMIRRLLVRAEIRRLDPDERYLDVPALGRLDEIIESHGRTRPSRAIELASNGTTLVIRRIASRLPSVDYEFALTRGALVEAGDSGWSVGAGGVAPPDDARNVRVQEIALPDGASHSITVRNRRRGDRFKPLGMPDEKKLSDFFIDRKIARDIRDTLPLVLIDGRIAWIAGTEVSEDFRLGRGESERLVLSAWRSGDDRQ
jgi:tRNA(Ile)-lysidine synthase